MFRKLLNVIVGDPNKKVIDNLRPTVDLVAELEAEYEQFSEDELREQTAVLKQRLDNGETLDDILVEAFALVREASKRTTGLRHYDVQIMGGILLHQGQVVEMRTGEGKTLVATLPLYLNALSGRGVHLVTVNEYLARRDGGWMGKIFHSLGLTVGCIGAQQFSALFDPDYVSPAAELEDERLVHWRPCTRQEAYRADITYGISSEFGFDYLRDNMARHPDELVMRDLYFAVIDEVDNILIDEARTPLIISGPAEHLTEDYIRFTQYLRGLKVNTAEEDEEPNGHYDIDEKSRSISLTDMGIAEVERRIPEINVEAGDSLYHPRFFKLTYYVDNALRAQYLYRRDREYVVQNNEVIIVDDFTGRLMPGRRYSDGLHEAIEAKEGVRIQRETVTVATITLQNYFRLYEKLAGMTGTAVTDSEEFYEIYKLEVTPLPTNVEYMFSSGKLGLIEMKRKVDSVEQTYYTIPEAPEQPRYFKRIDYADQVYGTSEARDKAIIEEILRFRDGGRPILVGTTSVEHSETISRMLKRKGVDHTVLNAKIHQSEALIVAQAGRQKAVTISTNMAGRGTDILLGGNPEGMAAELLEKELFSREDLTRLAFRLLDGGPSAARDMAQKTPKLSEDLVDALMEIKNRLDRALTEIEKSSVIGYLALTLQEPYKIDYNDLRQTLRLVRDGRFKAAREFLDEIGIDVALVEEAVRLWNIYGRYQQIHNNNQETARFLAEQFFERHYNGRASLIRTILAGEKEEARQICRAVPGLPEQLITRIENLVQQTVAERRKVWELGGLHVIGSERHESRRIDNQLRGRAARQGDPGSSRFFLSLEDDLMKRFGGERLKGFMSRTNIPDDMPIESGILDRLVESSQERVEGYNFDIRKNVVEYDDVMSRQRQAIYEERRQILLGDVSDQEERIMESFRTQIEELAHNYRQDYIGFMRGEIEQALTTFTDANDKVHVPAVLSQLSWLLPGIEELDRTELLDLSPDRLTERLIRLAHDNEETDYNLYQLVQAMSEFIPLLPPVPNMGEIMAGRRSGQMQTREALRRDFLAQVESIFNKLLADHLPEDKREPIWAEATNAITQAFSQFSVEGISIKAMKGQQSRFRQQIESALRDLLADCLAAFNAHELVDVMMGYVQREIEGWRERVGKEEFQNFLRLLLLQAIDLEWREYLTAMDDLRREIGLQAIAQRDPKVEYKRRSFEMFSDMRHNIDRNIVKDFFVQVIRHEDFVQRQLAVVGYREQQSQEYQMVRRDGGRGVEMRRDMPKVGRNDPCPCGSGKKYKQCHMRQDQRASGKKRR
jgi:preprotein translocase subunit SecA